MKYINSKAVRLGYVPLTDCAPLAVAKEKGLFEKYEVNVKLIREPGWASLRDKITYQELDMASSVSALAIAIHLGKGCIGTDISVPMMISMGGNAICLSNELDAETIKNGEGLRDFIIYKWKKSRPLTFAVVHDFSSHHLLLREWLTSHGVDPDENVEIITLPPEVIPRNLKSGNIDGYCVGEPWASKAALEGYGWICKTSMEESTLSAEKLLVTQTSYLDNNRDLVTRICKALLDACRYCQNPENYQEVAELLSQENYLNEPAEVVYNSFAPEYKLGNNKIIGGGALHQFHNERIHQPNAEKFRFILKQLVAHDILPQTPFDKILTIGAESVYEDVIA